MPLNLLIDDTFTEASDTSLDAHTLDTSPSSNSWTEDVGDMTVIASSDRARGTGDNSNKSYVDYQLSAATDFDIEADIPLFYNSGFRATGIQLAVDPTDVNQGVLWLQWNETAGDWQLGYWSFNDAEVNDSYTVSSPSSATVYLERRGDVYTGYIDSVQRLSIDVSGTTDISGAAWYPGLILNGDGGSAHSEATQYRVWEFTATGGVVPPIAQNYARRRR